MIAPGDLRKAMHEIAGRKGDFTVFGLFMRADAPLARSDDLGTWDLVASAPWLEGSRLKATTELVDLLKKTMGRKLVQELSRVVIIPGEDPTVQFLLRSVPVEDGEHHIRGIDLPRHGDHAARGFFRRLVVLGRFTPDVAVIAPRSQ